MKGQSVHVVCGVAQGGQMTPIDLVVEEYFHRAAPGGMGGTKAAGNYSPVRHLELCFAISVAVWPLCQSCSASMLRIHDSLEQSQTLSTLSNAHGSVAW